jgi:hypothetical protein
MTYGPSAFRGYSLRIEIRCAMLPSSSNALGVGAVGLDTFASFKDAQAL